ncbi:MAG: hypothetical protein IT355_01535 [Gemmatimonadaceae bacterium]|nr:hypothetical protein [Gemmatimonadaceae bacterium]
MSLHRSFGAMAALTAIVIASPLAAQSRSIVDAGTLDAAMSARPDSNRAAVTAILTTPRARAAAATLGLGPEAVAARLATLDDAGVRQVADQVLAGGESTVVISTTAIIIGLLLILVLTRA